MLTIERGLNAEVKSWFEEKRGIVAMSQFRVFFYDK